MLHRASVLPRGRRRPALRLRRSTLALVVTGLPEEAPAYVAALERTFTARRPALLSWWAAGPGGPLELCCEVWGEDVEQHVEVGAVVRCVLRRAPGTAPTPAEAEQLARADLADVLAELARRLELAPPPPS